MPHKLLAFGFSDPCVCNVIPQLASTDEIEKVFWVTDAHGAPTNTESNIKIIDLNDALFVRPSSSGNGLLNDALFDCYQRTEPIILKMLDRVEKHGPVLSYDERKNIFHNNFFYWLEFLVSNKISAFVSQDVPHEISDFIIAEICQTIFIPTIAFAQVGTDGVMPISHYKEIGTDSQWVQSTLTRTQETQLKAVFERRLNHYLAIGKGEPIQLFYTDPAWKNQVLRDTAKRRQQRIKGKIRDSWRKLIKPRSWRYALYLAIEKPIFRERAFRKLQRQYDEMAVSRPNLEAKYIYLGLHYQPEMTTSPLGEAFVDQYLIAHFLLSAFPEDVYVYVKEHPNQVSGGRCPDYYEQFPKSHRIVFINTCVSSHLLQQHCLAVATVVGTVGFEGLWSGKPALIFGNAYYRKAPGVYHIRRIDDAIAAADIVLNRNSGINTLALTKFLDWLMHRLIPANLNSYYVGDSQLSLDPSANASVLSTEILARLESCD